MKIRKMIVILLSLILLSTTQILSAVDPSWYEIDFYQVYDTQDNTINLEELDGTPVYLGYIKVLPGQHFIDNNGADWNGNITLVISSPISPFRLIKIGDDSYQMAIEMDVVADGVTTLAANLTDSPAVVPTPLAFNETPEFRFIIDIDSPQGKPNPWRGSYYSLLRLEVFVDYGTDNQVRLGDEVYAITSHFVQEVPTQGNTPIIMTDLLVEQYTAATAVDIPQLQITGGVLKVGAVNFFSDDSDDLSSYKIRISPNEENADNFAFYKTENPGLYIPYKLVVLPDRTMTNDLGGPTYGSQSQAFSVMVTQKGATGFWQDYFELGITQINYSNLNYTTGEYISEILIELIRN